MSTCTHGARNAAPEAGALSRLPEQAREAEAATEEDLEVVEAVHEGVVRRDPQEGRRREHHLLDLQSVAVRARAGRHAGENRQYSEAHVTREKF